MNWQNDAAFVAWLDKEGLGTDEQPLDDDTLDLMHKAWLARHDDRMERAISHRVDCQLCGKPKQPVVEIKLGDYHCKEACYGCRAKLVRALQDCSSEIQYPRS